ncbi:MAG: SpaA isopeptide-forming pilin-related protein, partial [Enterococcus sp.]
KTTLRTKNGQWWEFVGWDANKKTIASADVTFVGKWKYLGYEWSFIKQTSEGEGLRDAEFSLYQWSGQGVPANDDLVTTTTLTEGKWTLLAVNSSQENGRVDFNVPYGKDSYYQLVETKTPSSYRQPDGQWRFTFDENGWIKDNKMDL